MCKGCWNKPTGFDSRAKWLPLSLLVGNLRGACHTQRGQDGKGLKGSLNLQLAVESLRRTKDATGETLMTVAGLVPFMGSSECGCGQLPGGEQA